MTRYIFAAKSTKDVWHKGKNGNIYQLDSIVNQLSIECALTNAGFQIEYLESIGREKEAEEIISLVHDNNYLDIFKQDSEEPKYLSNGLMLQKSLYALALEHALIAKDAVTAALQSNLSLATIGGGHHCGFDKPFGFGLVNTMAISAVQASIISGKVAVLDLDTHYSNGCNEILRHKKDILMCSLWNQRIPAWEYFEKQDNLIHEEVKDVSDYFNKLNTLLDKIKSFKPTLMIYHLGFDVLETDRMGGIPGMNEKMLLKRELIIKEFLDTQKIPCLIYRGGGYINHTDSPKMISKRKESLLKTQISAFGQYIKKSM